MMLEETTMVSIVCPDGTCRFIRKTDVGQVIAAWQEKHIGNIGRDSFFAVKEVIKHDGVCNEVEFIKA